MKSSTGRWVSGNDFFDRESELRVLEEQVRRGNHLLLTGQRRMGKTSILHELGRKLEAEGWVFLFIDVEGANSEREVVADLAEVVQPVRGIWSRFAGPMARWAGEQIGRVEEIAARPFRLKLRDGIRAANWRRHGERLIRACAEHDKPVLIVSGSIGLAPLVRRLGIPDRINHLHSVRLGPWPRETSIECLERLAEDNGLRFEEGVANAVHEALGMGIPHYVQSFFARLQEFATMKGRDHATREDVAKVRRELIAPSGDNDLVHYRIRLEEGLGDGTSCTIAMEILSEAAAGGMFTPEAGRRLAQLYAPMGDDLPDRIAEVIEVLIHDGYLEAAGNGHRFPFPLLRDWWSARHCDHHVPIRSRLSSENRRRLR